MRAIQITQFGGPDELQLAELPDPSPAAGQVLIGIEAAGVNRADILVRSGKYHRAGKPPLVLGVEGAGTVLAVGDGVHEFVVGQRVVALGETNKPGFYAERAVVPVAQVVAVPDAVDLPSAAALPTAWLSAWYCLHHLLQIETGETILLPAAASGVGSAAVRMAVDAGATVIATAGSAKKVNWVGQLGAQQVLNSSAVRGDRLVAKVQELTDGRG